MIWAMSTSILSTPYPGSGDQSPRPVSAPCIQILACMLQKPRHRPFLPVLRSSLNLRILKFFRAGDTMDPGPDLIACC